MAEISDELLARIAERASDPDRRYGLAVEDQARVELPVEEIRHRFERFHAECAERERTAALRGGMSAEEYERNVQFNREITERFGHDPWNLIREQQRAWGISPPTTMSFVETTNHMSASTQPPGAKPLRPPPQASDWEKLERITGRRIPDELRRLYSIADGGFGPGFEGLNSVESIGYSCQDLRRRGPDYCGTIVYPDSFIPIAEEVLNYHYDLDTGRIISSNQDWREDGLEEPDVYDIAFPSLATMMEDWLNGVF